MLNISKAFVVPPPSTMCYSQKTLKDVVKRMTTKERRAKNAQRMRNWRARNPARANAIAATYRRRHPAKIAARLRIYREKNRAELYQKKKAYSARNRDKLRQWKHADYVRHRESYISRARKRWREKNEECRAYEAKRYKKNKQLILARHRDYVTRNREKVLAWRRSYFKSPRGRAVRLASERRCVKRATAYKLGWAKRNRAQINEHSRTRRQKDASFAVRGVLRARLNVALRNYHRDQNVRLPVSAMRLLRCTATELVIYLESKFLPGMSWDNRGKVWHIDHIRPLASFDLTDVEQQRVACHYTNLQPLWASDNFRKGARWR